MASEYSGKKTYKVTETTYEAWKSSASYYLLPYTPSYIPAPGDTITLVSNKKTGTITVKSTLEFSGSLSAISCFGLSILIPDITEKITFEEATELFGLKNQMQKVVVVGV